MKVGYYFWGHLGDKLTDETRDTPDGNAWYSSSIIQRLLLNGHDVYRMAPDLDYNEFKMFGAEIFNSFEPTKRLEAYNKMKNIRWDSPNKADNLPKLDSLLLEWRFPILGRNLPTDQRRKNFHPDLLMQNTILDFYKDQNTFLYIFDLDYKLTEEDEKRINDMFPNRVLVLETAYKPKTGILRRQRVEIPFWVKNTILPMTQEPSEYKNLVYIGSRYERDDVIDKHIIPFSKKFPFTVWFHGNWKKYPDKYDELYETLKWRDIQYHDRVGHTDFRKVYGNALACPLIGKQSYFDNGFMTARIQEALYYGTIPIGFAEHLGIEEYLPEELIVSKDRSIEYVLDYLRAQPLDQRDRLRQSIWKRLRFMDVSNFVDTMMDGVRHNV